MDAAVCTGDMAVGRQEVGLDEGCCGYCGCLILFDGVHVLQWIYKLGFPGHYFGIFDFMWYFLDSEDLSMFLYVFWGLVSRDVILVTI